LQFDFPVWLFQGTKDTAVTRDTALALLDHIEAADLRLTFKQGADHSFSSPECLDLLTAAIEGIAPSV